MIDEKYEVHPEIAREFPPDNPPMPDVAPVEKTAPKAPQQLMQPEQEAPQVEESAPEAPQFSPETVKSWRDLRLARERAEKERDDALRLLQMQQSQQKQVIQEDLDLDIDLDDESYVPAKKMKAYGQKIRQLEEQILSSQRQNHAESARLRLKNKYPDFEAVVNPDTLEMLSVLQPEVTRLLDNNPDLYAGGITAYTMIKNMNIQPKEMYREDIQRIQKNATKPKPSVSINPQKGESPLSAANAFSQGLTDELRTQLLKEMNDARRGY
jgi:hypothetical protein